MTMASEAGSTLPFNPPLRLETPSLSIPKEEENRTENEKEKCIQCRFEQGRTPGLGDPRTIGGMDAKKM